MYKQALLAQYRECWAHIREHKSFIWQLPTVAATITGAFIAVGLVYIPLDRWAARELFFICGLALIFSLLVASVKHRYFTHIWQKSILKIEEELSIKKVQIFTKEPDKCHTDYLFTEDPKGLEHLSAHNMLIKAMWVLVLIYIFLLVVTPLAGLGIINFI